MEQVIVKKKNTKLNYFYNVLYKLFAVIVPIITTPYLGAILGADGIGQYGYVTSYSTYFVLVAMLGFSYYGQRLIASVRDNKTETSRTFIELYISQLIIGVSVSLLFSVFAIFEPFGSDYKLCFLIEIISVVSVIFDVNYFLQAFEEFGKLAFRSIFIKVITLICIFIFVKTHEDLWVYALIISVGTLLSNLSVWPFVFNKLTRTRGLKIKPFKHFLPCFLLFLPTIAYRIYPVIDKTLIGLITNNDIQVGNYYKAQQIVDTCTSFVLAIGAVLIPRNSNYFATGKMDKLFNSVYKGFELTFLIGIPICLGIISIANNVVPWYLNNSQFSSATGIMMILSTTVVLTGLRNAYGIQYLVSTKQDKKYTFIIIAGACFNIILTVPLVFGLGNYGAAIASVVAELLICIAMSFFTRKQLSLKEIGKRAIKPLISGLAMFVVCFPLSKLINPSIINSIILVMIGFTVYFGVLFILQENNLLNVLSFCKKRFCKLLSFFQSKKYEFFLFYAFLFSIIITLLSYSPFLLSFNLNRYVFIVWLIYIVLILPYSLDKLGKVSIWLLVCWFPFTVFVLFVSSFLNMNSLFIETTKEILISCLLFFVGSLSSSLITTKRFKIIAHAFLISSFFVGINIFFSYFRDFDITARTYAYPLKNSAAPLLIMAAAVPLLFKCKNGFLFILEIIFSIFLTFLTFIMKCRAVIFAVPFAIFYLLSTKRYKKTTKWIFVGILVFVLSLCILIPSLRSIVIDSIILGSRDVESIDDISSGRFSLVILAIDRWKISPIVGLGDYYVDFEPVQMITVYGLVGLLLTIPSLVLPIYIIFKNKKNNSIIKTFLGVSIIILYINAFFEAYSPYGPGVKTLVLWLFAGIVCFKNWNIDVKEDNVATVNMLFYKTEI